jgi:hypothetical protein
MSAYNFKLKNLKISLLVSVMSTTIGDKAKTITCTS